ncbi:TA system antitoxin ParD family protein [Stenotrophobium rhamnosiphilum]|uniref:ParD-like antitoxin of type II toxin-antitoxin system n=1 Tax=Stenotrophobium rhamnosiphilum TaxID=2029166 RepID=A0A2T5MJ45_9GAMM|nr:hypothetical protein [Stenotrophobium rhamnosiphilum]PTU32578.1 hypothetical protein CJD38_00145 [Stenotrophobium rhamnosiphilum]
MSNVTTPIRLDAEITSSARETARQMSRSVAEQLSHWARIGRELERSPEISVRHIEGVLNGKRSYDALSVKEQALVRASWSARLDTLSSTLRLDTEYKKAGYQYAELDANGNVVTRPARARK